MCAASLSGLPSALAVTLRDPRHAPVMLGRFDNAAVRCGIGHLQAPAQPAKHIAPPRLDMREQRPSIARGFAHDARNLLNAILRSDVLTQGPSPRGERPTPIPATAYAAHWSTGALSG